MTVQEQIDRLKSDIAIHKEAVEVYQKELAELEKQAEDSHKNARALIAFWESDNSSGPLANVAKYVRHLEKSLAVAEKNKLTEPLCPRRVVATAAIVMQQSMEFLVGTGQIDPLPGKSATQHADAIRLLKQSAGTEAKPYNTVSIEDLDT